MPITGVLVLVLAALARTVCGRWWAGPVAAAAGVLGSGLAGAFFSIMPVTLLSPSQTYSLPLLGLLTIVAVEALRGRQLGWPAWAAEPRSAWARDRAGSSGKTELERK